MDFRYREIKQSPGEFCLQGWDAVHSGESQLSLLHDSCRFLAWLIPKFWREITRNYISDYRTAHYHRFESCWSICTVLFVTYYHVLVIGYGVWTDSWSYWTNNYYTLTNLYSIDHCNYSMHEIFCSLVVAEFRLLTVQLKTGLFWPLISISRRCLSRILSFSLLPLDKCRDATMWQITTGSYPFIILIPFHAA